MFRSAYADVPAVELPIHDVLLGHAAEFGDTPALVDGTDGTTLTYAQVDHFHRRVAAGLAEAGVREGDVLALHGPNTVAFPVAFYAATRAGATVTTVHPLATPEEVARQLTDPAARWIVTVSPLLPAARRTAELAGGIDHPGTDLGTGEAGEILIRGPQIMKGHRGRPDATAAVIDADGWLHTGDVGHVDAGGWLFAVDRVKELIKYKGYQVAPAELEAVLLTHPGIADAAVIGTTDDDGDEVPHAHVVRRPGADHPDEADVMTYVADRVAPYKRVREVTSIDTVPRAVSGEILRRQLRERP